MHVMRTNAVIMYCSTTGAGIDMGTGIVRVRDEDFTSTLVSSRAKMCHTYLKQAIGG